MTFLKKITNTTLKIVLLFCAAHGLYAQTNDGYVVPTATKKTFPLASQGKVAAVLVSDNDFEGVKRVVRHLQKDILNVTDISPEVFMESASLEGNVIIIGTLGKSPIVDELAKKGKINAKQLEGRWEKFTTQIVQNPMPGVKQGLVIAGSDKRGTIYGTYDLSNEIGVHPWHFWADVPAEKQTELHVLPGVHTKGEPKVKYRGFFINDEAPALTGWVGENYGKFNSEFYDKVFELILRMKGNYIWPSMWQPRMFYEDDPKNGELADEYGIVMGTSHHEPLTRAHEEWSHFGGNEWNFETNAAQLKEFWKGGIERMGDKETLVTIGMRGDGDESMSEGTAIDLLEGVVEAQREIIEDVTGKPAAETPQIWALYKEVQDYYDQGMEVPEDVTLLLCDDNWGNIRKLPSLEAKPRKGGYGIYYHFDYVGGPRNYKWLNTNQIERTWEQMHLAYEHGVNKVWIVNVGDIKPMEFPLQFFMDYAWNPDAWNADNLDNYYSHWTNEVFDGIETEAIADIMKKYTKYNARRKHELIDPSTFSLTNYNEADKVVNTYNELSEKAQGIYDNLPEQYKDAYYQLVLFPVLASANLNELYVSAAKNNFYAKQGRASANAYADKVRELFMKDRELTDYYHNKMADGKWNHMMSQNHIGYMSWQEPRFNRIPETFKIDIADDAEIGVAIQNSEEWWSGDNNDALLPMFDPVNDQKYSVEIFNRGKQSFDYSIQSKADWIQLTEATGTVEEEKTISISIDWSKAPSGQNESVITISGAGKSIPVQIKINNYNTRKVEGFVENNGFIAMDASHFSEAKAPKPFEWKVVDNLGKTGSAVISLPIKQGRVELSKKSPKLSYNVNFQNAGEVKVHMYFSPTINYATREGMYYGLSFDDQLPTKVNYDADPNIFNYNGKVPSNWHNNVGDNIKIITTTFEIDRPGNHTLNYYRVDEGLVLQRIVIETANSQLKDTYLGPPESPKVSQ
ncbi:glycosyl hydrolase 115 family protein [Muricauda oceani]|uniref:Glycosyl hydrolase n=1 Tax=Flagellimonas oceani TaxID=2698672 RepID=A0A6G7J5P5_9FLAO|nr:glycosyl hydrolase 115 family protein [Allomuricauda oceani]MBW8243535.1 glycosyl hydrolase 115 family protein [Allomuricauda oceani]QII45747.1 glycosyl hydrolase [Allomuricauda oceani]